MVGGGIFNLPQSAAQTASPAALLIGWATTGLGILMLVIMFRILSRIEPTLTNGLYSYAETGFGKFVSFLVAYGYWMCNCIATVAYGILIASTLNHFFPGVFENGTNPASFLLISCIIWSIFLVNLTGASHTAIANSIGTLIKFIPIVVFIILFACAFSPDQFAAHFAEAPTTATGEPISFFQQVTGSFFVTVFLFIGIEGAVVVSGQAKNQKVVAKATFVSYVITIAIYVIVSVLAFGVFSGAQIAKMQTPSIANLMQVKVGGVASFITNLGILISVASSWLVWILMLGQMPLYAARDGVFPRILAKQNRREAPYLALVTTCIIMECVLFFATQVGEGTWNLLVKLTPIIAMPCYLVCCLFLFKRTLAEKSTWRFSDSRKKCFIIATVAALFTVIVIASSELSLLLLTCTIYACGLPIFIWARLHSKDAPNDARKIAGLFGPVELVLALSLVCLGVIGIAQFF